MKTAIQAAMAGAAVLFASSALSYDLSFLKGKPCSYYVANQASLSAVIGKDQVKRMAHFASQENCRVVYSEQDQLIKFSANNKTLKCTGVNNGVVGGGCHSS